MTTVDVGGPAFPMPGIVFEEDANGSVNECPPLVSYGMTLRDYFAAKAMQGMCSISNDSGGARYWTVEGIAKSAYAQADAMLEARK